MTAQANYVCRLRRGEAEIAIYLDENLTACKAKTCLSRSGQVRKVRQGRRGGGPCWGQTSRLRARRNRTRSPASRVTPAFARVAISEALSSFSQPPPITAGHLARDAFRKPPVGKRPIPAISLPHHNAEGVRPFMRIRWFDERLKLGFSCQSTLRR